MHQEDRLQIIKTSWKIHDQVETSYLKDQAKQGEDGWPDKQRMLLADMALHLLQTSIAPGEIELNKLRNNMHAILTISDHFFTQFRSQESHREVV